MVEEIPTGENDAPLFCYSCQAAIEPLLADWCVGSGREKSLVCPSCGDCFCRAPPDYKQAFWSAILARLSVSEITTPPAVPLPPSDPPADEALAEAEIDPGELSEPEELNEPEEISALDCLHCHQSFNPAAAEPCPHVGKSQTLICPHCARCFCEPPQIFHANLWLSAPPQRSAAAKPAAEAVKAHFGFTRTTPPPQGAELMDLANFLNPEEQAAAAADAAATQAKRQMDAVNELIDAPHTGAEPYEVHCYHCQALYNASEASGCFCLGSDRTFLCPNCLHCFCRAPLEHKQAFWAKAPSPLRVKKAMDLRKDFVPPLRPDPETLSRPLIEVVTDNRYILKIAARALGLLGYTALFAADGQEGLELAVRYRPDLILTDAITPKLTGRELCRQLKSSPETSAMKVVIMTALYTQSSHRSDALKLYLADDYLHQPIDLHQLRSVIEKQLGE